MSKSFRLLLLFYFVYSFSTGLNAENIDIRDARSQSGLVYDLVGEGPLLVFIHGSNLDRRMWAAEVDYLKNSFKVLTYDLRGLGASDTAVQQYSDHEDLLALLKELGEEQAMLVGLSAGVQVALDTALVAPDTVSKLVLVSPSLNGYSDNDRPAYLDALILAMRAGDFEQANEVMLSSQLMFVSDPYIDLVRSMVSESRQWQLPYHLLQPGSLPVLENLESVDVPTLILTGDKDYSTIENLAMLLQRRMPDAEKNVIPGGSHLLNLTAPSAFQQELGLFLGRADP